MLVFTRRPGESFVVGDNATKITVIKVSGNKVRIGIEAPKDVPVRRCELEERKPGPLAAFLKGGK